MNSDESDWDSMSEAPPVPATQQGVELRYPPAAAQSQPAVIPPVVFPPQKDQAKGPGPPQPQPRPKPQQSAPNPKPRPPSGKPPPEARAHQLPKKSRPKEVEGGSSQKKIVVPDKISVSLDNSFSDLNQEQYEDSGLGSSPEKASNALKGVENQGYEGDNDDEDEEGRRGVAAGGGQKYRLPVPDERIALLPFEDMRAHYLQVEYDDEGLLVDRVLPTLVHCCSRGSAELLGLVKLPLVLLLVCLGQVNSSHSNHHHSAPGVEDGDKQPAPPRLRPSAQAPPGLPPQPAPLPHLLPLVQPLPHDRRHPQPLLSNRGQPTMEICPHQ